VQKTLRLDRWLANTGCGSRNEVKQLIKVGRVGLNGQVTRDAQTQVAPELDRVTLDGELVIYQRYLYLMLHKPAGVISATEDRRERTVLDLIDPKYRDKGLFPVGRLDKDTEGLLLLTNHGALGHQLLSPKKHVVKNYLARVAGWVTEVDQAAFRTGIGLDDGYQTLPAELTILKAGEISEVQVALREGKFHQIKRMFQALDKEVIYLKRFSMGPLVLDEQLGLGEYRELTAVEIAGLTVNPVNNHPIKKRP
jgi:16S rRNA pseudouridine516 synthase